MKKFFLLGLLVIFSFSAFSQDEKTYRATVTEKKVNIRSLPTTKSDVVKRVRQDDVLYVRGLSDETQTIDGYTGHWALVSESKYGNTIGWIFTDYLSIDKSIYPGRFSYFMTDTDKNTGEQILVLKLTRCYGGYTYVDVKPRKNGEQEFYTFTWGPSSDRFCYYDPAGIFTWTPEQNSINHISYEGADFDCHWAMFTEDMKYLIEDNGPASSVRNLTVKNVETGKILYSGFYYRDLFLEDNSIVVVEVFNEWNKSNHFISNESIKKAEEFKRNVEMGFDISDNEDIIVRYRLDLESLKMQFRDCSFAVVDGE